MLSTIGVTDRIYNLGFSGFPPSDPKTLEGDFSFPTRLICLEVTNSSFRFALFVSSIAAARISVAELGNSYPESLHILQTFAIVVIGRLQTYPSPN